MNKPNKPNDYFAASINRPDLSIDQMYSLGITPSNTELKDREYYKNIPQVKNKFTDADGNLNEEAYNNYYEALQRSYNEFSQKDFVNKWLNNIESSPYDIFALDRPDAFDATVRMVRNSDPQRHQISMSGIGVVGDPSWDEREVAQENFVRDQNGNKLNWTPNQKGFFGALTGPTLVLATYDEDGYHEENGREVFHHKGQQKYDENGDPYYEVLGDRTIYGKDVLHVTDVISKDGSWFNRNIDFLDSDSLDKSIGKTIFKTATQIGLFAIPGAGPYLGAIKALMDFSSVLPVFAKSIDGFVTGNTDDPFGKSMSKWEGVMSRFDRSQTAHAKEHQWSFENVADMLGNSAGQLYSQRVLGEGWMKLFAKNSKDLAKLQKTAQRISLGYMALTSAEESYSAFKNAGANDRIAGLGFILTASAMWGMMNNDYFKEWLFKDSAMNFDPEMRFTLRDFAKEKGAELSKELGFGAKAATQAIEKEKEAIFIKRWWTLLKEFVNNHKDKIITGKAYPVTSVFANHAFNEGVEELMEEVSMDLIKGLSLGAERLGFDVTEDNVDKLDFGFSPEDFMNRYLTSFVGGALGGAVFEGLTRWENHWRNKGVDSFLDLNTKRKLLWYISNGYEADLRKALEREYRKEHLGDPNLSWSGKTTIDSAGNATWTADTKGPSQNEQMFNLINEVIDTLKFQADQLKILDADDRVVELAIQHDDIAKIAQENIAKAAEKEGLSVDEYKRKHRTSLMEHAIIESGADEFIFSDIWSAKNRILELESRIKKQEAKLREGENDNNKEQIEARIKSDPDIKNWRAEQKRAQQEYQEILEGKRSREYIGLATMLHNDSLRDVYLKREDSTKGLKSNNDKDLYTRLKYGESYYALSENMKEFVTKEYDQYYSSKMLPLVRQAYDIHMRLLERNNPKLKEIQTELQGTILDKILAAQTVKDFYESWIKEFSEILPKMKSSYDARENKLDEEGIKLREDIDSIENEIARMQAILDSNDPELLSRALEYNDKEKLPYSEDYIPEGFNANPREEININELLDTAIRYFEYLKSKNVILGIDNPVVSNIKRNIMQKLKSDLMDRFEAYVAASKKEIERSQVARQLSELQGGEMIFDEDGSSILDTFERRAGGLEQAERLANDNGFLPIYKALKSYGLYKKIRDGFALTDEEQYYLNNSALDEKEIDKYLEDGYVIDPEFKALNTDDVLPIASSTSNFFSEDTPQYVEMVDLINKFTNNEVDLSTFNSELETIKNGILKYLTGEVKEEFEAIFKPLENVVSKLTQLEALKAEVRKSPVTKLLGDIYVDFAEQSTPIIEYLNGEVLGLKTPEALDNYAIDNPEIRKQLETIKALIPVLDALVQTTIQGGFNDTLNTYKEKGAEDFIVLQNDQINLLKQELNYIKSRINTLLSLSNHAKSNVDKQIDVQTNMRPKYLSRFIAHVDQPGISKKIYDATEKRINTEQLWKDACGDQDFTTVTKDNFKAYFAAIRKWEQLVHDKFKEEFKTLTASQIGQKIASFFDIENRSSEYNDDPDTVVSDMNLALYLLRVVGLDPNKYYGAYKKHVLKEGRDYPFDGQEMVIGMGLAVVLNKEMFNAIVSTIKVDDSNAGDNKDYIADMPLLKSFLAILGGDGTGKSKIVTRIILDLARALTKTDIVGTTAYERRLREMKSELDIDSDNKLILLSEIIKQVHGGEFTPDDYEFDIHGHPTRLKEEVLNKLKVEEFNKLFNEDAKLKILAIDEGTFASEAELMAFTYLAEKAGVFVLLNGDLNQQTAMREFYLQENGEIVKENGKAVLRVASTGLEDCKYAATPILSESVRVSNQGMRVSRQLLRDAVNIAVNHAKDNPAKHINEIIENTQNVDIAFQYHETSNNFAGVKILQSGEKAEDYVTKFTELTKTFTQKPSVGIITNSDKYSAFASDNVEIVHPKAVQGQEYDYVIIDVDLSGDEYTAMFDRLKSINTWVSRGKRGVVMVAKPEMQIKDGENHFNFTSTDIDNAIISIDSKRDHPEQFKQYRAYIDDLYSDVQEVDSSEDISEGEDNGSAGGGGEEGGEENPIIYASGQQTSDGKGNPEEQIDAILEDAREGRLSNSDGYRDEENYANHYRAVQNKQKNLYSLEEFFNWLYDSSTEDLLFRNSPYNPFKDVIDPNDEELKKNIKVFIQGLTFALTTIPKYSDDDNALLVSEYLRNHVSEMKQLLVKSLQSIDVDNFLNLLFDALDEQNDAFSIYTFEQTDDDKAMLWFVFGNNTTTYRIPIGYVFGQFDESKIYKDLGFGKQYDMSIISTKGAVHTPIAKTRFANKVHLNSRGGVFIPTINETQISGNESVKNFFKSKGRFYNIWDLNIFSNDQQDIDAAKNFFTAIYDQNGNLLDFTQHDTTQFTRIKGTHKLVRFEKYVALERMIHALTTGKGLDADTRRQQITELKQAFNLTDRDIEILEGNAEHWDIHDDVVYNAVKHDVNRKSDLLNYIARGNMFSALLRLSMRWAQDEDSNKSGFSSTFITNFLVNYVANRNGEESNTYSGKEGNYVNGITFSLNGTSGSHRVRLDYFVSFNRNGFSIEVAQSGNGDRIVAETNFTFKKYLNSENWFDIKALTKDILLNLSTAIKSSTITYDGEHTFESLINGGNLNEDIIENLFSNGAISIIPSKRYQRNKPGEKVPKVSYYVAFDSDVAEMVPIDNPAIKFVEDELRKDPIFKYGMYAIEKANDSDDRENGSQFSIIKLNPDSHLTDIADIMLPGFMIDSFDDLDDADLESKILLVLNKDKKLEGKMSDSEGVLDKNILTFDRALLTTSDELSQLLPKNAVDEIVKNVGSEQFGISVITIENGKIVLKIKNLSLEQDYTGTLEDIIKWLQDNNVMIKDTNNYKLSSNGNLHLYLAKTGFTILDIMSHKYQNYALVGTRTTNKDYTLYFKIENTVIPITVKFSDINSLDLKSRIDKLINPLIDRGTFILNTDNGTYYLKDNSVLFYEDDLSLPAKLDIISITNDVITFKNGTSINVNDIFDEDRKLFEKIKEILYNAVMDSEAKITDFKTNYKIRDFIVQSSWLITVANIDQKLSDTVNIIELTDNTITILDGNNEVKLSLNEDGKQYFKKWIQDNKSKISKPNKKYKTLLSSNIWQDSNTSNILNQIQQVINESSNPIDEINSIFTENAGILGGLWQIRDDGSLKQDVSSNAIAWVKLKMYFKDALEIQVVNTDGKSYWNIKVTNSETTTDYILKLSGGEYVLDQLDDYDSKLTDMINTASEEDKPFLQAYRNHNSINGLFGWIYNNRTKYADFFKLMEEQDKNKDNNICKLIL